MYPFAIHFRVKQNRVLTCPRSQIGDLTDQVIGDGAYYEGVLNTGHKIADQHPLHRVLFVEATRGHVVALGHVLRAHVLAIVHRPPPYHVRLDSALGPGPFQGHIRRVHDRGDVEHRVRPWRDEEESRRRSGMENKNE